MREAECAKQRLYGLLTATAGRLPRAVAKELLRDVHSDSQPLLLYPHLGNRQIPPLRLDEQDASAIGKWRLGSKWLTH